MKRTASVVELKARLSEHLRLVKAGRDVVVRPSDDVTGSQDGRRRSFVTLDARLAEAAANEGFTIDPAA